MSQTNETTTKILSFFFKLSIFAYRSNSMGVFDTRSSSYRTAPKVGVPDITGILPPSGRALYIEVKTGKDRMRPEQEGFKINCERMGALHLIVKDFEDFKRQWLLAYAATKER